jgi:hypothetical protein
MPPPHPYWATYTAQAASQVCVISVSFIICMLTLLLIPLAGLHFCVGLDFVRSYCCNIFWVNIIIIIIYIYAYPYITLSSLGVIADLTNYLSTGGTPPSNDRPTRRTSMNKGGETQHFPSRRYIYIYISSYTDMFTQICVNIYILIFIYICMYMYIYMCIDIYIYINKRMYDRLYAHT